MGKILVFTSIVISLATAGLGFVNKNTFFETRSTLADTQADLTTTKGTLAKTQGELKTTAENLATTTSEKVALESQVTGLEAAVETAKAEAVKVGAEKAAAEAQVTQLTAELEAEKAKLLALQPSSAGGNPIDPTLELKTKIQEQETLIATLQANLDTAIARVETFEKEKQDRLLKIAKKGLEGRVLAVNPAWNFVVLNLGDKNGVVNNTELLVKRGTQLLGKVRVTSVEPSTSIADIVANSVPQGATISPGDNVIFQTVED